MVVVENEGMRKGGKVSIVITDFDHIGDHTGGGGQWVIYL